MCLINTTVIVIYAWKIDARRNEPVNVLNSIAAVYSELVNQH